MFDSISEVWGRLKIKNFLKNNTYLSNIYKPPATNNLQRRYLVYCQRNYKIKRRFTFKQLTFKHL